MKQFGNRGSAVCNKYIIMLLIGMVTPEVEHLLCEAALGPRLNCMTVGIIQWTGDCVPQMLL